MPKAADSVGPGACPLPNSTAPPEGSVHCAMARGATRVETRVESIVRTTAPAAACTRPRPKLSFGGFIRFPFTPERLIRQRARCRWGDFSTYFEPCPETD